MFLLATGEPPLVITLHGGSQGRDDSRPAPR
jgi:hypothetical protein